MMILILGKFLESSGRNNNRRQIFECNRLKPITLKYVCRAQMNSDFSVQVSDI